MTTNRDEQKTKQAIQSLLKISKIAKVIYIDDFFEKEFHVEDIIGEISGASCEEKLKIQTILPGISLDNENDVLASQIRALWNRWSPNQQKENAENIFLALNTDFSQDFKAFNRVISLFPNSIKPIATSPSEWINHKEEIFLEASPENKILCIFDQNLNKAVGIQNSNSRNGMGLIKEIIIRDLQENIICCLLTWTISLIDKEMAAWRELAIEHDIKLCDFLPLAKVRLEEENSSLLFADGIKKALLNLPCEKWKQTAIPMIETSTQKAISQLRDLEVYDFEYIVFRASISEGIWELETLNRLFQIFHRDEFRNLVLDPENSGVLNNLINDSQRISDIKFDSEIIEHTFHQIGTLRTKELFESAQLVKHTPLNLGDLFVNEKDKTTYILLMQPCDLMVRCKDSQVGKRNNESIFIPLIPFKRITHEEFKKKTENHFRTHSSMSYYYSNLSDIAEISFSGAEWVDIKVLDLAVLDPDGKCQLNLKNLPNIPEICTIGWKKRLEDLIQYYSENGQQLNKIHKHVTRMKNQDVKELIRKATLTSQGYLKDNFNFHLKRIGRYRRPGSDRLLKAYMQYLSRDAEEMDFAKEITKTT